jgi:hypothetical protein
MNEKYEWQYNGAAPMIEILVWCRQNLSEKWSYNDHETIYFDNSDDYTYFLLRWI